MSEEKQEAYLFIGGVMDGQWVAVPESARRWNVPVLAFTPLSKAEDVPENLGWNDKYEQEYFRYSIARNASQTLHVFLERSIADATYTLWDVMCKLVNNYKVIK